MERIFFYSLSEYVGINIFSVSCRSFSIIPSNPQAKEECCDFNATLEDWGQYPQFVLGLFFVFESKFVKESIKICALSKDREDGAAVEETEESGCRDLVKNYL